MILGPCSKLPVAMLHSSFFSRLSTPSLCLRSGDLAAEAATIAQRYAIFSGQCTYLLKLKSSFGFVYSSSSCFHSLPCCGVKLSLLLQSVSKTLLATFSIFSSTMIQVHMSNCPGCKLSVVSNCSKILLWSKVVSKVVAVQVVRLQNSSAQRL